MMMVSDFPEDFDLNKNNSLGLQLVKAFTQQLKGNLDIDDKNGTKINITFPKPEKEY